ncbi:HD-domain-containing protein [Azoarcus olearius]|uniref:HD-GYP domain-containing protein n=1 Tax=Azoarcus sp. (strain BH72) TaxID=418699 RepID=UPI0008062659|nr:HD-GYP domain-containing protein [Azoarcus olearius]ANQ85240.1 HD-domain-containing protein [Azoarcus olearius]
MQKLSVDRLRPGLYVSLASVGWMRHPFLLNEFRISSEKQLAALRELGIATIDWDPARSTAEPLPETQPAGGSEDDTVDFGAAALDAMLDEKRARLEHLRQRREGLARRERQFEQEAAAAAEILKGFPARANEAHARCKALVADVVAGLVGTESMVVHLVNQKARDPGPSAHALNVMVLSLLLGRAARLPEDELRLLGVGALLHDLGKAELPPRIVRAAERTPPEETYYRAHIGYGIKALAAVRELPVAVRNIVACHHEHSDGSGFPNALAGEKIPRLARIVAIANRYDNLCNPFDLTTAKTPSVALRQLFAAEGKHFDGALLQLFVKTLGVFPPGSFVQLSNGATGLVIETHEDDLLHPLVMLYDRDVPRSEAMLLDLKEVELKVESALSPARLPLEVVEYLAPRGRVDYYVEGAGG